MAVEELRAGEAADARGADVSVSRQAIVDAGMRVTGYLISYATAEPDDSGDPGESSVTRLFSDVLSTVGLEELVGSSTAHLSVSAEMLLAVGVPPVPPDRVVLRVAHAAATDPRLGPLLPGLTSAGFSLTLCDLPDGRVEPELLAAFDTVEVDFSGWDELEAAAAMARIAPAAPRGLAVGLLTYSDFEMAQALGFDRFAGPFLAAPQVTSARQVPVGDVGVLASLARLQSDAELEELEELIDHDLGLSVKLLRYINSAYFGLRREITSIRQAVMMLGTREVSRWALVIALAGGPTAPRELSVMALTRARMCQLLAEGAGVRDDELFTIGLLSLADALLDMPLGSVVSQLPLAHDLEQALLWRAGPAGETLAATIAFERGDFAAGSLKPHQTEAPAAYRDALRWARETVSSIA
jgi:EAL and modified HD-GYP domain-containing signal transduction protein